MSEPETPAAEGARHDAVIHRVVAELAHPQLMPHACWREGFPVPMPALDALAEAMGLLRALLFPGYFGPSDVRAGNLSFHAGIMLDRAYALLSEQIKRGLCFECGELSRSVGGACAERAQHLAAAFLERRPAVRQLLMSDAQAAYEGDPAARSPGEVIFCYPSLKAMTNHRVAHELHRLGVGLIPRIISESAHSETGIDIHPGAEIGERFFMDHGTGIVIGETCVIGRNVRLYQGVTLGAKSFPLDENGRPIKGIARHPIVEDDVIIYSGATVLGRVTIGRGSVIGGNVWLTRGVPPRSRLLQGIPRENGFENGGGI